MAVEIKITFKDEDRTLSKEWLIYEEVQMSEDNLVIQRCLKEMRDEFKGEPDTVKVKALMVIR